jgi:5-formyltetrahydrofolate cyclo-ligase
MELKDQARANSLASRAKHDATQLQQAEWGILSHDWAALCPGKYVTCYVSMAGEPPTEKLREHLKSLGKTVLLPIMKPGRALAWGIDEGELVVNNYGVAQPVESHLSPADASLMIIPALRAGRDGTRLGRGAGYYDRALAATPSAINGGPTRLVLVFDDELVDSVPHEPHDEKMDGVITPTELLLIKN